MTFSTIACFCHNEQGSLICRAGFLDVRPYCRFLFVCSSPPPKSMQGLRDASLPRDVLALDELLGCKGSVSPCSVSGSVSFLLLAGDA
ncbi:hypothetical protein MTO96_007813 [Rhipicephalus appendiculatus]